MDNELKARLVAIHAKSNREAADLRIEIIGKLDRAELKYLQVGAGKENVYAVLPDEMGLERLEEIVAACDAIINGTARLFVENRKPSLSDKNWAERILKERLIKYDIPHEEFSDFLLGICRQCGGVGQHVGPPCLNK